jgi:hypothetical protein
MISESGEVMFERLCAALSLASSKIPEAASKNESRPDFKVLGTDGSSFLAEVKLISPSRSEAHDISRFERGEIVLMGGTPGDRLRDLIGKANRQLRALSARGLPGVLVVFNPRLLLRWHTDPYSMLTTMRGLDVVDVKVPVDPRTAPALGPLRSGPKKQMTATSNTSTAAVICPHEEERDRWIVNVYHNRHAKRTFPVEALTHHSVQHWRLSDDERDWVEISTSSS